MWSFLKFLLIGSGRKSARKFIRRRHAYDDGRAASDRSDRHSHEKEVRYEQGYYTPCFTEKYRGDVSDIIYRLGWELIAFKWCDYNPRVLTWASEEKAITYYMKGVRYPRRYYPDLLINFGGGDVLMVEIKPKNEHEQPSYENRCKWAAARAFCRKKGWRFKIWDEKTIHIIRQKADYWLNIHHQNINRSDEGS